MKEEEDLELSGFCVFFWGGGGGCERYHTSSASPSALSPPPSSAPVLSVFQHLMFPNHETGRYSVSEDGTLRIRDVRYEDEGQYVCQGLNVLGSEKALATIAVKGQPPPPSPLLAQLLSAPAPHSSLKKNHPKKTTTLFSLQKRGSVHEFS